MYARFIVSVFATLWFCVGIEQALAQEPQPELRTLDGDLYELSQLRAGRNTDFDAVAQTLSGLLRRYESKEEQGRIYAAVAAVYAESGQVVPGMTIQYCRKALEYPLPPLTKAQTLVYWGDAIQVQHAGARGTALAKARKEAIVPYLMVLKEMADLNVPDEPQPVPAVGRYDLEGVTAEQAEAIRAEQAAQLKAYETALQNQDLIARRDAVVGQIAFLYSRFPFANDELRALATEIVPDRQAVDRLMAAVEARVRQRLDDWGAGQSLLELPPEVTGSPHDATAPATTSVSDAGSTVPPEIPNSGTDEGIYTSTRHPNSCLPGTTCRYLAAALAVACGLALIPLVRQRIQRKEPRK